MAFQMKFSPSDRTNPYKNPFLAFFIHVLAIIVAITAIYYFLAENTFVPIYLGFIIISVIELIWLYFHFHQKNSS